MWRGLGRVCKQGYMDKAIADKFFVNVAGDVMVNKIASAKWKRVFVVLKPQVEKSTGARLMWYDFPPADASVVPAGQVILWGVKVSRNAHIACNECRSHDSFRLDGSCFCRRQSFGRMRRAWPWWAATAEAHKTPL